MKFPIFLVILNTIFVNAETDCRSVIKQWYGIDCGTEMKCSSNFACNVTITDDSSTDAHCSQYSCVEADRCPDGTTYSEFWINDEQAGFACTPPQHQPSNFFECNFDDDGKLTINAVVDNIKRHPAGNDFRNYTMISYESWENNINPLPPFVEIFDTSNCYGIEGPEKTSFSVVNSTICSFTNRGMLYDDMGIPFFVQSVVFGYDDLVHNGYIRAYGASTTVHCQISAFDTLFVNPAAGGARDDKEEIVDTQIIFDIGMYRDDTFTEKMESGEIIDISPDAVNPAIYVQVEADLGSNSQNLNMVHIKQCKWSVYEQVNGEWEKNNNTNSFMVNGCANVSDNEYIDLFLGAKDTRSQFANDEIRTFNVDQFYIYPPANVNNAKFEIECDVVACSVASFERTDSSAETSFCFLDEVCSDRYDNLKTSVRSKKMNGGEYQVSEVQHIHKFELFVNCPGNNCIGGTEKGTNPPWEEPPNSSSTTNFLSCLILFISIYLK